LNVLVAVKLKKFLLELFNKERHFSLEIRVSLSLLLLSI